MKKFLKRLLGVLHISVTRNQRYDDYTRTILRKTLKPDSNCVDIGCHKGEILDLMIKGAPRGKKIGFEPIPELFQFLVSKYLEDPNVTISQVALYDTTGTTTFQHVLNAPAYSGIKKRKYDGKHVKIDQISVETGLLDDIIPTDVFIDLVKIDVEGAELDVLKGARECLRTERPFVLLEWNAQNLAAYGCPLASLLHFAREHGFKVLSIPRLCEVPTESELSLHMAFTESFLLCPVEVS